MLCCAKSLHSCPADSGESPGTEDPGGLLSMGSQRLNNDWVTKHNTAYFLWGLQISYLFLVTCLSSYWYIKLFYVVQLLIICQKCVLWIFSPSVWLAFSLSQLSFQYQMILMIKFNLSISLFLCSFQGMLLVLPMKIFFSEFIKKFLFWLSLLGLSSVSLNYVYCEVRASFPGISDSKEPACNAWDPG